MKDLKTFFSLMSLMTLFFQDSFAATQNGNQSGQNFTRNLFEYNLFDRNRDRLRGRGVYEEDQQAYPNQYDYIQQPNSVRATDDRFFDNNQ